MEKKEDTYELIREGEDTIMRIDYSSSSHIPSLEDDELCMSRTVDKIVEAGPISKIVFTQKRDYEYDYSQTQLLVEISRLVHQLVKQRVLATYFSAQNPATDRNYTLHYNEAQELLYHRLKADPLGAYVELKRILRRERIVLDKETDQQMAYYTQRYISFLTFVLSKLDQTKLLSLAKPHLSGFKMGERDVYRKLFYPTIKPDFMFTKLMASYPTDGEELDNYVVNEDTEITVFKLPDSVQYVYHMMPPEFKLTEEKYELLDMARKIMSEHQPKKSEFVDPERMRQVFFNVGRDLLEELSAYRGVTLRSKDIEKLTNILVRYTVGFGLIEVLLQDERIQDISVNSPMGQTPLFIVHSQYGDCVTNIIPTPTEAESWASKLRMISGRPLDEADPILDTELELPGANTRVSVITQPLDPSGLAYSFRRHRDRPWTLPLFIKAGMINPLGAGLISFLVDGTRTILIAGTRSSGKTSFMTSVMVEIMRRTRVITIEDTLELPTNALRKLGYNIQPMKVASALSRESAEVNASDGIRATLRLGDSALIVGEVRSKEAVALYEAMRVGAAANVVAGTIHGDSPYGVYDRVVNDIGIPKTSFKATDIIIVATPVKSADGIHSTRRITQITEVRKKWDKDPLLEHAFVDLMKYDVKTDQLVPQDALTTGDSDILKDVAGNIKEFAGNWDAVWENIVLRGTMKQLLVDYAEKTNDNELLEAPFVIKANDLFHVLSENVREEVGFPDPKRILFEWEEWLKGEMRKRVMYTKNA
ncbi:type II/IV secretion system ATPase subunit [Candidatus Woesearchaeota archaeon]|nr:type II/IV secretion system ATPase subunit [Candidatus Woesearchaeota archaeon]